MSDWQGGTGRGTDGSGPPDGAASAPQPPPPPRAPQPGWPPAPQPGWPPAPQPGWTQQQAQWPSQQPAQQPSQWPGQQGQGPASYGTYAAPDSMSGPRRALIGLGVVAVVIALVAAVILIARPNNLTAATSLAPDSGTVVYTDDFAQRAFGWSEDTLDDGSTFANSAAGYVITGRSETSLYVDAPSHVSRQQLSVSTTASLDEALPDTGFGVVCFRGGENDVVTYEFIVMTDGAWYIARRAAPLSADTYPTMVASGDGATAAGTAPLKVVGVCASLDSKTTRLVMFVDGEQIADQTDTRENLPSGAWMSGIMVAAVAGGPAVTFTHFELRDISKGR